MEHNVASRQWLSTSSTQHCVVQWTTLSTIITITMMDQLSTIITMSSRSSSHSRCKRRKMRRKRNNIAMEQLAVMSLCSMVIMSIFW